MLLVFFGKDGFFPGVDGRQLVAFGFFLVDFAEEVFQLDLALQLHHAVQQGFGAGGAAGNEDIHGQDFVHALHHMVGVGERTSGDGAVPYGHYVFGVGHLFVQTEQDGSHLGHDGSGHHDDVGLARTGTGHFKPEPGKVVACGADAHELDAAAAGGEGEGPYRVGPTPVDQFVQHADDDADTVSPQFFDIFVIFEFVVGQSLDFRFLYFHVKAPFFQAYARPKMRTIKKKRTLVRP